MTEHSFKVFGARGTGYGPIGERKLDQGVRLTPAEVSRQLAASHATEAAVAEVIDFPRIEGEDAEFAQATEQAM